jgi:ABC-type multidrug transport system fused ATPase/permease subunit
LAKKALSDILKEINQTSKIEIDPKNSENYVGFIGKNLTKIKGNIEFKDVVFKYPGSSSNILNKINIKIESGKSYAFVGSSGCGKSTIFKLLTRFYEFNSG